MRVLILSPVAPSTPEVVLDRFRDQIWKLIDYSKAEGIQTDYFEDNSTEEAYPTDKWGPVDKVARIRNRMIDDHLNDSYDYVFWIDSDLVEFRPSLLERLMQRSLEKSIIAPMNLVEGTETWYDWGAFIQRGTSNVQPLVLSQIYGRNLTSQKPYWHPGYLLVTDDPRNLDDYPSDLIPMDSVAQCLIVPARVYKAGARHKAENAFYEFWPICETARKSWYIHTYVALDLVAYHADRSLYGPNWGTP